MRDVEEPERELEDLRDSLEMSLQDADDEDILDELSPDLAGVLEDVAGALRAARTQVAQRGPGALRGAVSGLLVGGPAGALVGGAVGAAGAAPLRAVGSAVATLPQAQIDGNAAAALLLTLLRPEVAQALVALAAGGAGVASVPVAGVPVPVGAFANLIQSLAERAGADHQVRPSARGRLVPPYLADAFAEGLDVSRPETRAAALLELLADAADDEEEPVSEDDLGDQYDADLADLADLVRLGGFDP